MAVLLLPTLARAQTVNHQDEMTVRTAYAQLSFLTELKVISDAALDERAHKPDDAKAIAAQMTLHHVTFELSHFETGDIEAIADLRWGDLVAPVDPSERVLKIQPEGQSYKDEDLPVAYWLQASATWEPVPEWATGEGAQIVQAMSLKDAMDLAAKQWVSPDVVYTRYARYMVTAHLDGHTSGPYHAIYFFGRNAKGEEVSSRQDVRIDGSFLFPPLYPAGLLRSRLRETPVAARWLNASSNALVCGKATATLCCSDSGDRCGVSASDLQKELSTPLPVATPQIP